ncbi:MAG: NosD domain-containing protein [Candidatus Pacebacteria bacterium]|nr:NosD domain-containing protein [Candidatus Paceibacterota bacterium]
MLVLMWRAGVIAVALFFTPFIADASALFLQFEGIPGMTGGDGSHFQIADSDYLNISLDTAEPVRLMAESVPNVITMRLEPSVSATSTELTITGLVPDTAYYKYEDNYHNLTLFTSDSGGAYAYVQDLSQSHTVFIQTKKSTKFILDDATGGDCASIGTWDSVTLTCTLSTDLSETLEIDSDSITLDGAGHSISGSHTGNGVYLDGRTGVTIKNLRIANFSYGVTLNNSNGNRIEGDAFIDNDYQAIVFYNSHTNVISGNTVSLLASSSSRHQGFTLFGSHENSFQNNTISLNAHAGTGQHQAILLFDSNGNTIVSNSVSDTYQGILIFSSRHNPAPSHDNIVRDNRIQDSVKEGIAIFSPSSGNQVYHNNFIRNGARPVDYGGDAADVFNLQAPEGGNYWDAFDEPSEGCDDANLDGLCDAPYVFSSAFPGGQDALSWTSEDGWKLPPKPRVSNVLFLPGIEGSRLYEGTGCGKAVEEKLWEPYESLWGVLRGAGDRKVRDLALDSSGASVCADIYAKEDDVIDSVRDSNIYKAFLDEMNGLKADGTVNDWKPIAYDWRLSLDDLLTKGAERDGKIFYAGNEGATSTPYIEQTLRSLAASSKSGKVTIVAHSNGGLVTKALLSRLGSEAPSLVDKILMVGVPQSGAPESIGAALMGYSAGIYKYGFSVLSNAAARALAQNSPMMYHLLPSEGYLESIASDVDHPVARFAGDGYAKEIAAYGSTITNTTELNDFLLAREGGRKKPKASDTSSAEILNQRLIDYATSTHAALDLWTPPAGIEVSQIAGWGADTVAGIDFYTEPSRILSFFGPKRKYKPIFIEDGDGTVPVPSALLVASSTSVKRYWVNLNSYRIATSIKREHKDLFEIPSLEEFIKNIITSGTSTLPAYISTGQPAPLTDTKKLIFFLRSSRVLYVHSTPESDEPPTRATVKVKDPSGKVTGVAEDDSVTEDIPGSTYGEFGDVQYIIVPAPASPSDRYELTLHGQMNGGGASGTQESTFSLDIQESGGGVAGPLATLADIPLVASTTASLTIAASIDTASPLVVDESGDGTNVITVTPVIGETVLYEPPVPLPQSSGGAAYASYVPLDVSPAPDVATTTLLVVESVEGAPVVATDTPRSAAPRLIAAVPRIVKRPPVSPPSTTTTAYTVPSLSQTASVYDASQQPVLKRIGEAVYTSLYRLWVVLRSLL